MISLILAQYLSFAPACPKIQYPVRVETPNTYSAAEQIGRRFPSANVTVCNWYSRWGQKEGVQIYTNSRQQQTTVYVIMDKMFGGGVYR